MTRLTIPPNLARAANRPGDGPNRSWLDGLPAAVVQLEELWAVTCAEPYSPGGETAWVAPAKGRAGQDLVVKFAWRHPESAHEADGLRAWAGRGAVQLHAVQELAGGTGLLLERCLPGELLSGRPESEQDAVITSLLPRLWLEPEPLTPIRPLMEMCQAWTDQFQRKLEERPWALDSGLAREAAVLFVSLAATARRSALLCTDLHGGNVLSAQREPWLVVDPKPYCGDPTYDPLQHMLNCGRRLQADPADFARRMADLLGLEADRLRLWVFARCVLESLDRPALAAVARRVAP